MNFFRALLLGMRGVLYWLWTFYLKFFMCPRDSSFDHDCIMGKGKEGHACPELTKMGKMMEDIHRAVVGNEQYGHRGLISRMDTTEEELKKVKDCVNKERWTQRAFVSGVALAVTVLWNATIAFLKKG